MKLTTIIENKLKDVKLNQSKGTLRFYKSHTSHFIKWCDKNSIYDVEELTEDRLIDYINFNKETASAATINKRVLMLKRIYLYNNIEFEFLSNIKKFKETKKTFNIVSSKQIKEILNYINTLPDNKLMYILLIHLLIDTGARINEIMNIKKSDIKLSDNEILLTTTKTKIDRVVYFLNDTKKLIAKVLDQELSTPYLFYNLLKNRQINYDDVRYFFRHLKSELDIDILHAHMFRHSLATTLIENDADLISVMQILGHQNIKTTERYLHLSKRHIKKTYKDKFKR